MRYSFRLFLESIHASPPIRAAARVMPKLLLPPARQWLSRQDARSAGDIYLETGLIILWQRFLYLCQYHQFFNVVQHGIGFGF
jgi:hypothetical protein